jgi:CheY-like chemotaxis protein
MKVLTNLINNAAEAINEQGAITISSSQEQIATDFAMSHNLTPGEYAVITVCDDGPGIAADDLTQIFEPFFTRKIMGRSGTGLGLTVVWNTLHDHGGVVTAESTGKGSYFHLYFPTCKETITLSADEAYPKDYQGNDEAILVVDDEHQQRLICKKILTILGYQVTTVASGEEAVEYMQDHAVDLLILDMIMTPGIDGKETYARINALHPGQKAIIASGFSKSAAVQETLALGVGQYIKKPYTMAQLGQAVKKELSSAQ